MRHTRTPVLSVLIATTLQTTASLAGTNVITNGNFDTDLSGWTALDNDVGAGARRTSVDADDNPNSGSAYVGELSLIDAPRLLYGRPNHEVSTEPAQSTFGGCCPHFPTASLVSDCVAVDGGDDYVIDVKVRSIPDAYAADASPIWFTDSECQSGTLASNVIKTTPGIWVHRRHNFAAPANAVAVRLRLRSIRSYFDDVRLIHLAPGEPTTTTTSTTTTTTPEARACGDPVDLVVGTPDRDVFTNASDALYTLQAAIGVATCPLCECDVDDSGAIEASDALRVLRNAVGQTVPLTCPACDQP